MASKRNFRINIFSKSTFLNSFLNNLNELLPKLFTYGYLNFFLEFRIVIMQVLKKILYLPYIQLQFPLYHISNKRGTAF